MRKSKLYALVAVAGLIMIIGAMYYMLNGPNGPDQIMSTFGRSVSVFLIGCAIFVRSLAAAKQAAAKEELQCLQNLKAQIDAMCTATKTDMAEQK